MDYTVPPLETLLLRENVKMTDTPKDGGPAFATGDHEHGGQPGMSLRDWFAGIAMQGLQAGLWANPNIGGVSPDMRAYEAYEIADAMLAEREKPHD